MAGVTVSVLRSVKVSDDGITNRWIIAGTDDAVPADAVDGLEAEGYVSRGKEKVPMASSEPPSAIGGEGRSLLAPGANPESVEALESALAQSSNSFAVSLKNASGPEPGLSVEKDKFGRWAVYRDGVRITKSGSEDAARAALQEMAP